MLFLAHCRYSLVSMGLICFEKLQAGQSYCQSVGSQIEFKRKEASLAIENEVTSKGSGYDW